MKNKKILFKKKKKRKENLDRNESHEKKTKHIHASGADLLHIRIGNLDWCKCRHCKNEAREIDCLLL